MTYDEINEALARLTSDAREHLAELEGQPSGMIPEEHRRKVAAARTRISTITECGIALTLGPDAALAGAHAARKE